MSEASCPYGDKDCPKLEALRDMVERNSEQIDELAVQVSQTNTTVKNIMWGIGIIISAVGAGMVIL